MSAGADPGAASGRGSAVIVAEDQKRASKMKERLAFLHYEIVVLEPEADPVALPSCELFVWIGDPDRGGPGAYIERIPEDARAVLVLPRLNPRWIAHYLRYDQVGAFLAEPISREDLEGVVKRVLLGAPTELELLLSGNSDVEQYEVLSYEDRCRVIDRLNDRAKGARLRGKQRRSVELVTEELLMNAMYQAPMDQHGTRAFEHVEPKERITAETPRPVNVKAAIHDQSVFVSVRDHYGSFRREDLASHLLRCAGKDQIEDKTVGAGLGLFQIASMVTRLFVNIAPGRFTDFVCVLDPPEQGMRASLKVLSLVGGRQAKVKKRTSLNLASVLAELREVLDEVTAAGGEERENRESRESRRDTIVDMPLAEIERAAGRQTMVEWPPKPEEPDDAGTDGTAETEIPSELLTGEPFDEPDEQRWDPTRTSLGLGQMAPNAEGERNVEAEEEDTDPGDEP